MKYRKKPVVIDAVQWTGTNHREMFDFLTDYQCTDQYMSAEGKNFYIDHWNHSRSDWPCVHSDHVRQASPRRLERRTVY